MKLTFPCRRHAFAYLASLLLVVGSAPAPAEEAADRSFLWRVRSDTATVWLLGSIHFMKADASPLSPAVEQAFTSSSVVVFEADLGDLQRAAVGMIAAGGLEDGTKLEEVVPAPLYRKVVGRLEELGMGAATVGSMRPWMAALTLTSLELSRAGYLGDQGIDATLYERAGRAGKERRGLETAEYQVSLFASLSDEEGLDFLRYTLEELDSVIPMVDEIVAAWRAGETERLEALLAEGFDEHPELYRRFVTDRNRRWLPGIEALLRDGGGGLVVVGSLHLVGPEGLVALLEAEGYEVTQL
ncbi:MAG TPA: TraB/GumN family protein [Candidatus Sulfomarinibacteraceae bacterium]|nr:TraB/GumN family protein [Candidatus Sulfomarinibacteraceae bacterium]